MASANAIQGGGIALSNKERHGAQAVPQALSPSASRFGSSLESRQERRRKMQQESCGVHFAFGHRKISRAYISRV